ncbi:MAG TPA: hypothetical protein VGF69_19445 [Thermoanaerobaculia bacterium]|jgi:hypothetical protein
MTQRRFAGILPLAASAFVTFWVLQVPTNKYAFDGPTTIPPDPDTILVLVLLSILGQLFAIAAVWRARVARGPWVQWSIALAAALLGIYDALRLAGALPHFQG